MAFRANEEIDRGRLMAMRKFLGRSLDVDQMAHSEDVLGGLIDTYGPVVEAYPYWHPLVADNKEYESPVTLPGYRCGYTGLDHTVYLRGGFITCPYDGGEAILKSVKLLEERDASKGIVAITAEKMDAQLYHPTAQPIFVKCEWFRSLNPDGTIPTELAVPLLLERELAGWRSAQRAETWKTMASYILGRPCGGRSSLFVNEETGQALKTIWNAMIRTGMFGPVKESTW